MASATKRVGHLDLERHPINDRETLRATVQLAVNVELTTVPPYLTALYCGGRLN
jgi:hypothetical protein